MQRTILQACKSTLNEHFVHTLNETSYARNLQNRMKHEEKRKNHTYKNVVGVIRVLVQTSADFNQNVANKQEEKEFCEAVFVVSRLTQSTSHSSH